MGKELIKHRLKRELRSRGVRVNRLLLDVSDNRIVISGEVGTFYEVQLIQIYATTVGDGLEIINNLSVVPTRYDLADQDPHKSDNQSEVHRLRNRLNEATLAMRLLEKVLFNDDIAQAKNIVTEILKSMDSAESEGRQEDRGLSKLKTLVVEDDTHQCLLLTGLLRHLGADVAHACDADSAFRALNEGFTPDVVLLDMHLPVENGATIARAIRQSPSLRERKNHRC